MFYILCENNTQDEVQKMQIELEKGDVLYIISNNKAFDLYINEETDELTLEEVDLL